MVFYGGMATHAVAFSAPDLVRRFIQAGTSPGDGAGIVAGAPEAFMLAATVNPAETLESALLKTFFSSSHEEQNVMGKAWWKRINERTEDRSNYVGEEGFKRQIGAAMK